MTTTAPHRNVRGLARRALFLVLAVASAALLSTCAEGAPGRTHPPKRGAAPQSIVVTYTTHKSRVRRDAVVLLPAGYRPGNNPPIPLVISPHGRGATGLSNSKFWGRLPTIGRFAVVNPDGMGRRMKNFSYGYAGQIDDLARMPEIVSRALPWVKIDRTRIYALGSSMGGQETLLLVARHPRLLAGAAAMDSVTDLSRRYDQVLELPTNPEFVERWGAANGVCLQSAMRREVGATPDAAPGRYEQRSPLSQAAAIARSGVPLQIWWSRADRIVFDQAHQSLALARELRRLGHAATITTYRGSWAHSKEMRSYRLLPLALSDFGLLPQGFKHLPASVRRVTTAGEGRGR
jgi:pimeloyl-ACP methyl ester carboxylesterase